MGGNSKEIVGARHGNFTESLADKQSVSRALFGRRSKFEGPKISGVQCFLSFGVFAWKEERTFANPQLKPFGNGLASD
jgi:hypothetical protein